MGSLFSLSLHLNFMQGTSAWSDKEPRASEDDICRWAAAMHTVETIVDPDLLTPGQADSLKNYLDFIESGSGVQQTADDMQEEDLEPLAEPLAARLRKREADLIHTAQKLRAVLPQITATPAPAECRFFGTVEAYTDCLRGGTSQDNLGRRGDSRVAQPERAGHDQPLQQPAPTELEGVQMAVAEMLDSLLSGDWQAGLAGLNFFREHLSALIADGSFTSWNVEGLAECLIDRDRDRRELALRFFSENFTTLLENECLTEDTYRAMADRVIDIDIAIRVLAIRVISRNFSEICERGWFSAEDLKNIERNDDRMLNGTIVSELAAVFIREHAIELVEYGLMTRENLMNFLSWSSALGFLSGGVRSHEAERALLYRGMRSFWFTPAETAALALTSDGKRAFLDSFHGWKSEGKLTQSFFSEILQQGGFSPEASAFLGSAASDQKWLGAAVHWQQAFALIGNADKRAALENVIGWMQEQGVRADCREVQSFIAGVSQVSVEVVQGLLVREKAGVGGIYAEVQETLLETAQILEVGNNPQVQSLMQHAQGEDAANWLAAWHDEDMVDVWENYQRNYLELHKLNPKEAKKIQRRFLNYCEAQSARSTPSWTDLLTRRAELLQIRHVQERLVNEASTETRFALSEKMQSKAWSYLRSTRLYQLLFKAHSFMEEKGRAAIRDFMLGFEKKAVKTRKRTQDKAGSWTETTSTHTQIHFPTDPELTVLFGREFWEKWEMDYEADVMAALPPINADSAPAVFKEQLINLLEMHRQDVKTPDGENMPLYLRHLPARVGGIIAALKHATELSPEVKTDLVDLLRIFEIDYREIRKYYGDAFAQVRTDLRNYLRGMESGAYVAQKSEKCLITKDPQAMALSGSHPVESCQTLERPSVNLEGQPVNMLMLGQFKLANWVMDDTVVARRKLEITLDSEGRPHLLVENLYTGGRFARAVEFKEQIVIYARDQLGIPFENIHFSDDASRMTAPLALKSSRLIYRDTFTTPLPADAEPVLEAQL